MLLRRLLPIVLGVGASIFVVRQLRIQGQEIAALRKEVSALAEAEPLDAPARHCPTLCAPPGTMTPPAFLGEATKPPVDQSASIAAHADEPEPISPDEQLAHLDATFVSQVPDQTWAGAQRERTSALLGSLGSTASEIVGVECRGSLCRAQLTLADEERYNALMHTMVASPEFRTAGQQATVHRKPAGPDGRVAVSIFLTKEGTELPILY